MNFKAARDGRTEELASLVATWKENPDVINEGDVVSTFLLFLLVVQLLNNVLYNRSGRLLFLLQFQTVTSNA